MAAPSGERGEHNADCQWLLKEATWEEFWYAVDLIVDWIEKREQISRLRPKKGESSKQTAVK